MRMKFSNESQNEISENSNTAPLRNEWNNLNENVFIIL